MRQQKAKEKTLIQKVDTGQERIEVFERRKKEKKRKRRFKKRVFVVLILIFVAIIGFLISPLAQISTIVVNGNERLTTSEVRTLSGISEGSNFYFNPWFVVEARVKSNPLVNQVHVTQGFGNRVEIAVVEYNPLFWYNKEDGIYVALTDSEGLDKACFTTDNSQNNQTETSSAANSGENMTEACAKEYKPEVKDMFVGADFDTTGIPIAVDVNEVLLPKLSTALADVPIGVRSMISEIHGTPTELDDKLFTLYMSDGNIVVINLDYIGKSLRHYKGMIDQLPAGRYQFKYLDGTVVGTKIE